MVYLTWLSSNMPKNNHGKLHSHAFCTLVWLLIKACTMARILLVPVTTANAKVKAITSSILYSLSSGSLDDVNKIVL